ncbi:SHOCT domain-containing protein [Nocardioides sp. GY 10127]|uniref:SHOCT domain-containing protein n=1 Tax=Nocardioides sp. GY 10127 TaxID=2569762 RepID=UPI0010A8118B|nr:SHOCT domain-containing protein [Nocardioides sp. GY 10127]TIC85464.1 SHOCT domain-containing protein [Nocardioides sp. GY 10127]
MNAVFSSRLGHPMELGASSTGDMTSDPVFGLWVVFVLVIIGVGIATTAWRVTKARGLARRAGLDESDAVQMSLLSDDGLEATYLAASLRSQDRPVEAAAAERAAAPTSSVAERLRAVDDLHAQGVISEDEHREARARILGAL